MGSWRKRGIHTPGHVGRRSKAHAATSSFLVLRRLGKPQGLVRPTLKFLFPVRRGYLNSHRSLRATPGHSGSIVATELFDLEARSPTPRAILCTKAQRSDQAYPKDGQHLPKPVRDRRS